MIENIKKAMSWKFIIIVFLPITFFAQQESSVTIRNGNKNIVEVIQKGKDTLQKSNVKIIKSDSNRIKIDQDISEKSQTKDPPILKLLLEYAYYITAIIFAAIGSWQFFKNKKKTP